MSNNIIDKLKKEIVIWNTMNDRIKQKRKEIRDLQTQQKESKEFILRFMKHNQREHIQINQEQKIEMQTKVYNKPMSQDYIKQTLLRHFQGDSREAYQVYNRLLRDREQIKRQDIYLISEKKKRRN